MTATETWTITNAARATRQVPLLKRTFDLVLGLPACLVALPVIVVFAVVLAVQLRTWPFFTHERVGLRKQPLRFPKLRTLPSWTNPYADKTVTELRPASRFAAWLRRTHLDELPQLFLVPLGRLSLVGPRPRPLVEASTFDDEPYASMRTSVPQGCTGLWQVSPAQHARVSDGRVYDYFYVEQSSLRLDLWIIWRTVRQLISPSPVTLDDVPRWARRRRDLPLPDMAFDAAD